MGKPIIWSGVNAKLINSGDLIDRRNNSLTNGGKITVTQASHGFTSSDIGRPLYLNGTTWTLAQADTAAKAEVAGFIYSVIDANTLLILLGGEIPAVGANFLEGGGSLTAGTVYFLSPTTAGKVTATEPTTTGLISKPLGIAETTTGFIATKFRNSFVVNSNPQNELNVVTNPLASLNTTGWTASGLTLTRDATGSPLDPVVPTGFNLSASATSQTFTSSALTVPSTLRNKKLKLEFYYSYTSGSSFTVDVLDGSDVQYALTTDSSGTTTLAQMTGKFVCYFDSNNTSTCKVKLTSTGSGAMKITQIIVGPGIQPQGAVVGEPQAYSPTVSNITNINTQFWWQRIGSNIRIWGGFNTTSAPGGTGNININLLGVLNLTADLTKIKDQIRPSVTTQDSGLGYAYASYYLDTSTSNPLGQVRLVAGSSTTVEITSTVGTAGIWSRGSNIPGTWGYFTNANLDNLFLDVTIPIAEWAGSGTVQLAQNDVELSFNSSTTDADDTTSFGYGPSGNTVPNISGATNRVKRVRFQTPIQTTDIITIEVKPGSSGEFSTFLAAPSGTTTGISWAKVNATDIDVTFGFSGNNANTAFGTATWATRNSSNWTWRVRKSSAGAAVGFGIVSPGVSSGLVSASGLPGNTTGNAIAAGYVGEEKRATFGLTNANASTVWKQMASITLTPGVWLMSASGTLYRNGATLTDDQDVAVSTTSASGAGATPGLDWVGVANPVLGNATATTVSYTIVVSSTTTYYLNTRSFYSAGTPQWRGAIIATRIA